jgi:hypothetical protein
MTWRLLRNSSRLPLLSEVRKAGGKNFSDTKEIHNEKHNANSPHYGNNEVGQRRENQQDRIAQGIRSGGKRDSRADNVLMVS